MRIAFFFHLASVLMGQISYMGKKRSYLSSMAGYLVCLLQFTCGVCHRQVKVLTSIYRKIVLLSQSIFGIDNIKMRKYVYYY